MISRFTAMAKIYISYAAVDKDVATRVSNGLKELGHEIVIDVSELMPGIAWREKLSEALSSSDGVVAIITENSLRSQFVMSEIGAARAYYDIDRSKFLIPIIFGEIDIPPVLQDIYCLRADKYSWKELAVEIDRGINALSIQQKVAKEKNAAQNQKIEANTSIYVQGAIATLTSRENRNKIAGNIWYTLGFACLIGGVLFGIWGAAEFLGENAAAIDVKWAVVVVLVMKTGVIIGLLLACSKYSFTLGKSYINEALKNADRAHAISFGKFYLEAYGANAKWEDLKEAFQYWNINNESSFSKLDPAQYDPKFVELIVELSKVFASKAEKSK